MIDDRSLDGNPLSVLDSVEYLELSNNQLKTVPLLPNTSLSNLHITNNHLDSISAHAFREQDQLEELRLSANNIGPQIEPSAFDGLDNLLFLNVDKNRLEKVSQDAFRGLG